jgi:uncharacterized protein (TIGR02172 family)
MKGSIIGEGNTAEVYSWGEKEILKLFRQEFPVEAIEKEYRICKTIENLGLSIPKASQLIDLDGRRGIIYEKISGDSMLHKITARPILAGKYSRQLAQLHYEIHQCRSENLPKYKEALEWNIRRTDTLTEEQKTSVLQLLGQLPEGDVLCHGDFHPGNIMMDEKNTYILDWMTAASGTAEADVARTLMLLNDAGLPSNIPGVAKAMIKMMRHRMANAYLRNYLKLSGLHKEDIMRWRVPLAAARMLEWISEPEKEFFLRLINKEIKKVQAASKL